jgi:hypothetical protein
VEGATKHDSGYSDAPWHLAKKKNVLLSPPQQGTFAQGSAVSLFTCYLFYATSEIFIPENPITKRATTNNPDAQSHPWTNIYWRQ